MRLLKEMLLSTMFVLLAAVMLVACGGDEGTSDPSDAPEVKASETNRIEAGLETLKAAEGIKKEAEEEEWFPEEVVDNGSAANN